MRDDTVRSTLPLCITSALSSGLIHERVITIETECNEQNDTNNEIGTNVRIAPRIRSTCPVERQKHQRSSSNEQKRADRIASPHPFFEAHSRIVGAFLRPVERE